MACYARRMDHCITLDARRRTQGTRARSPAHLQRRRRAAPMGHHAAASGGSRRHTAWGFTYKTCFVTWVKPKDGTRPAFGVGYYTRSNAECCFLAVKGKIPLQTHRGRGGRPNSVQSIVVEPVEHSRKLDVVRDKIARFRIYPASNSSHARPRKAGAC